MSLCPVQIDFHCQNTYNVLSYVHPLPRSLIPVDRAIQQDFEYATQLDHVLLPIMKEHEVACQEASSRQCLVCGSETEQIVQTPISFFIHDAGDVKDPFLTVWVHSLCGKEKCEAQKREDMDRIMSQLRRNLSNYYNYIYGFGSEGL